MPISRFASISGKIAIVLSVILIIAGSVGFINYIRFQSRVNQLKANDELMSLEDIVHLVEDPRDDALTYLTPIFEAAAEISKEIPRDELGFEKTDADSIALFDRLATTHVDVFAQMKLAANAPDMSLDFDEEHNQNVSVLELHIIGSLLAWKGKVLVAKGDIDGGANVALELLQLSNTVQQPFLMNLMLRNSFRVNAFSILYEAASTGEIDAATKAKINLHLENLDLAKDYQMALKLERSVSLYYIINPGLHSDSQPSAFAWLTSMVPAGPAIVAGNTFLDQMETIIDRGETPWSKQYPVGEDENDWSILSAFGGDLTSSYNNIRNAMGRVAAASRATRIVLALGGSDRALHFDDGVTDHLVRIGVPEEMTIDPFTDLPLQVKQSGNRWLVYSIGPDKIDDGGSRDSDDCGLVPRPVERSAAN